MDEADRLLAKYAAKARDIYANRTEGDYTWEGLLASFAFELAAITAAPEEREQSNNVRRIQ